MSEAIGRAGRAPSAQEISARGHRLSRWMLGLAGTAVLLLGTVYVGGGWYFSNLVGERLDASARLKSFDTHNYALSVTSLDAGGGGSAGSLITLGVTPGIPEIVTEGVWGVRAPDGGFGQVGRITARSSGLVTREFRQLTGPAIHAGEKLELVNDSFPEDPMAGLAIPYTNVSYQGPLGSYPAWFIAGTQPDWAILVHGDSMHRQDTLEVMGPLFKTGLPMLVITYRNDPGAPATPDGLLKEGATEWQDLQAAVVYALDHGARNVLLVGRSMGGGIVLSFLERSPLASRVKGAILDAPMASFSKAVDYAAAHFSLPLGLTVPGSLVAWTKLIVSWRYGLDWGAIDYLAQDSELKTPILLFQGGADQLVPRSISDQLAADRPDLITYVVTPGAGHLDSWNLDPQRYEAYVENFVSEHAST